MQGFELRHISVQVCNSNPYSTGAKEPNDEVLKMTICGLPLSVDDSAVLEMLEKYKVGLKSEIKYERIRNPVTHRMTTVLNGNRFVYTEPLPPNTSLPRFVHCAGLNAAYTIMARKLLHRKSSVSTAGKWGIGKTIAAKQRPAECATRKVMNRVHPNVNIMSQHLKIL